MVHSSGGLYVLSNECWFIHYDGEAVAPCTRYFREALQ